MIKIVELFAGIGTQRKAFEEIFGKENVCVEAISEIDPLPQKVYKELFHDNPNLGDITKIQKMPQADVWTYSFPCTDLSIAGKQEGLSGKNSKLLYEVLRLLDCSYNPKILIMENVANLVGEKFYPGFQEWVGMLSKKGYNTSWLKMKSCDYGGATIRNRVFAVSILGDKPFVFPKKTGTDLVVKDYLEPFDEQFLVDDTIPFVKTKNNFKNSIKLQDYKNGGQGNRIYSIFGQGITITASGGGKGGSSGLYLREEGVCKLSKIEMAKMMGWSYEDALTISNILSPREAGFVFGNAIDKTVLKSIVLELKKQNFL